MRIVWFLCLSLALGLAPASPRTARAEDDAEALPAVSHLLVVGGVSRGGRVAVFQDAVEARIVDGTWATPKAGDRISAPGGLGGTWKTIGREVSGWFEAPELRGGYAVATVESPEEQVLLLHARGHRHVYVNGEPRVGDVYDNGSVWVPVLLRKGPNELLFKGGRGRIRIEFRKPDDDLLLDLSDRTVPHLRRGISQRSYVAVMVTNATPWWQRDLQVDIPMDVESEPSAPMSIPPLSFRKGRAKLDYDGRAKLDDQGHAEEQTVYVYLRPADGAAPPKSLTLKVVEPGASYLHTFISDIDGSVQAMGITPWARADGNNERPALFLSCHGASVPPMNQARAYKSKDWGVVVAPTNRRPFGFDWEDWGRLDALEVLAEAKRLFDPDPARIYLTGHSMGGHGTWSLGAHYPDRFAAIGPSAGWRDFWSYGGGVEWEDPTPQQAALLRASNVSRTMLMEPNYLHHGIYVLHGDQDDNVPVSQARFMRGRLAAFHPNFAYYEQPGAGHWWGDRCVDWPPMFDFFKHNTIPEAQSVKRVRFVTISPAINDRCYWVRVVRQRKWSEPSEVDLALDVEKRRIEGTLKNVQALELDLGPFGALAPDEPITVKLGERTLANLPWPEDGVLRLEWDPTGAEWKAIDAFDPARKGPHRAGPFKEAFRNRFVLVVGTIGTDAENAWSLQKARYDAETFWYRGNGAPEVVCDIDLDARHAGRNLILYGNGDTNGAWDEVLDTAVVDVRRGSVRIGAETFEGDDLGVVMVRPRKGSDVASVGIVAGTGLPGMRVTTQMPFFLSGAGFPDWMVVGADMPTLGSKGIRAAGFFTSDWTPE